MFQLIVVMASHCYLSGPPAELFVEYLVRHCAISDQEIKIFKSLKEASSRGSPFQSFQNRNLKVRPGLVLSNYGWRIFI